MFISHPTEIGPYRVLEVLGQGGVGTVYLVQQREPIRRKAALKLVKLGMDTREVLVRFQQERQMLALMNHPNIAKVFDAGQTETGRPYFVMEYVAGEPITDYCDRNRLDLRERLELFVTVCRAIQHAHQRGILHRDVKPSNILVSRQEDRHVPVVIDFGLAKVLRTEPASANLLTREGQFLGTPRYMSPEQIELPSDEIDVRADVYSLGVVLFELIVGQPPNERQITDGGLPRLLRAVREEESPRPSTRLTQMRKQAEDIADKRRTDRTALMAEVRGDLDWIAVKALERDRDRRYQSAAELAADVERYLKREPIAARPPTAIYRFERYVRRNPIAVVGMIAAVLALVLGSGLSIYSFKRANDLAEPKVALGRMCEDIRTDVSYAHLWFEEIIAGDQSQDLQRDVLDPLNLSAKRVKNALEGTAPSPEQAAAREPARAEKLDRLRQQIDHFLAVTTQRLDTKDGEGRIGEALDQLYDGIYKDILNTCKQIVTELNESSALDFRSTAQTALAVNGAILLVLLGGSALALRLWLRRT